MFSICFLLQNIKVCHLNNPSISIVMTTPAMTNPHNPQVNFNPNCVYTQHIQNQLYCVAL